MEGHPARDKEGTTVPLEGGGTWRLSCWGHEPDSGLTCWVHRQAGSGGPGGGARRRRGGEVSVGWTGSACSEQGGVSQ